MPTEGMPRLTQKHVDSAQAWWHCCARYDCENRRWIEEAKSVLRSLSSGTHALYDTRDEVKVSREAIRILAERCRREELLNYELPEILMALLTPEEK